MKVGTYIASLHSPAKRKYAKAFWSYLIGMRTTLPNANALSSRTATTVRRRLIGIRRELVMGLAEPIKRIKTVDGTMGAFERDELKERNARLIVDGDDLVDPVLDHRIFGAAKRKQGRS